MTTFALHPVKAITTCEGGLVAREDDARHLPTGTVVGAEMLMTKRPDYGIRPKDIDLRVGRVAGVDIEADDVLTWDKV